MRIFIVALSIVDLSIGWGMDGHKIVAYIAQQLLEREASNNVASLLDNLSLADIATWADEVDHTPAYAWSKCMHYIDYSGDACAVSLDSDCASGCCVVAAIGNYTTRITDQALPLTAHTEALKFLVHFMGDIHQPLHAGSSTNRGGNEIHVKVDFRNHIVEGMHESNLHSVWDSVMIEQKLHRSHWIHYASEIIEGIRSGQYDHLNPLGGDCATAVSDTTCTLHAAEESSHAACSVAYVSVGGSVISTGDILTDEYYQSRIMTVEDRLAMAGIRLGQLLNELFPTRQEQVFDVQVI